MTPAHIKILMLATTADDGLHDNFALFAAGCLSTPDVIARLSNPGRPARCLYLHSRRCGRPDLARRLLPFASFDDRELISMLNSPTPDVDIDLLAANLDQIVLSDEFPVSTVPSAVLRVVAAAGLKIEKISTNSAVHSRLADFALTHLADDPDFALIFGLIEFSRLRHGQIIEIFAAAKLSVSALGLRNARTVIDLLCNFQVMATNFLSEIEGQIKQEVAKLSTGEIANELSRGFDRKAETLRREISAELRSCSEGVRNLSEEIERLKQTCDSALAASARQAREVERLRQELSSALQDVAAPRTIGRLAGSRDDIVHIALGNIFSALADHFTIKAPIYKSDRLKAVLTSGSAGRWSSDPKSRDYPSFTIQFSEGIRVRPDCYRLSSGFPARHDFPHPQSWRLAGGVAGSWAVMGQEKYTQELVDGNVHQFECSYCPRLGVSEIQFSMTGRNKLGAMQLYIGHFDIGGYVIAPRRILDQIRTIADLLLPKVQADAGPAAEPLVQTVVRRDPGPELKPVMELRPPPEKEAAVLAPDNVIVNDNKSGNPHDMNDGHTMDKGDDMNAERDAGGGDIGGGEALGPVKHGDNDEERELESDGGDKVAMQPGLITEIAGIEEIRELSSSRFGAVRLVRRRSEKGDGSELFAAKFYNAGDSKEGRDTFMERMKPFIYLNHPGVMPIRGMIAPTKGTGPIVLTPYSECGSLEDVLNRVRKNDSPPFWNNTTITKIMIGLITGLEYLHRQGIVHRELKPSDVIIFPDGRAKVDGYLTSYLEEHKLTKATQVGSPFYMAPEVYDDDEEGIKSKDPKTDVFSFALIGFELVAIARVFPMSMAAATIMRRVMSARQSDRPRIPENVPGPLSDLIQRCWVPLASNRPTFEGILHQMNKLEFRFFPDVDLRTTMDISRTEPTSRPLIDRFPPDRYHGNESRRKSPEHPPPESLVPAPDMEG